MNKDQEHLRWLSTCSYIYAGITALFACFPFIHVSVGIAMISGAFENQTDAPAPSFGWFFVILGGFFIVVGWSLAICAYLLGRFIKQRKHYIFCVIAAGISCLFAPFGTLLGVFALIVLLRDSVKDLFNSH